MSSKGFTVIELLIAIGIIAVLTSFAFNAYTNAQRISRDTQRKADLKAMQTALESYRLANGSYPSTGGQWWAECINAIWFVHKDNSGPNGFIPNLAPDYMSALPRDPHHMKTSNNQCYAYRSDGINYKILAHLTPESYENTDTYLDPCRPGYTWQVSSGPVQRGVYPCNWTTNGW